MFSKKFICRNNEVCDFDNHVPAPLFRKSFLLDALPGGANLVICGLGLYELYINGKHITKGVLAPYINNPDDILYYDSYNIKEYLVSGENVIGIMLGNGFFNAFGGYVWDFDMAPWRGGLRVAFSVELEQNGKITVIEADETVKTAASPVLLDDLRIGAFYDANKEQKGWNEPGFDDSAWSSALPAKAPSGEARFCEAEPVTVYKELPPVGITHYNDLCYNTNSHITYDDPIELTRVRDVYLYDFGENNSGICELKISGKKGQCVTLRFGETLIDGKFSVRSTINMYCERGLHLDYPQMDKYILKGEGEETFVPPFTYHGFRYALVEGITPEQATKSLLTYKVISSEMHKRADFSCSDDTVNQLYEMTIRSDRSNFVYVPTDCPHREKNGWTADIALSAEQMLINLTAEKSMAEWMRNVCKAQREDGALPGIIPTAGWGFEWGNGPAWDCVCVYLPYYCYKYTGDIRIVTESLPTISRYLSYISDKRDRNGLVEIGLNDWAQPLGAGMADKTLAPLIFTDSAMVLDIAQKAAFLGAAADDGELSGKAQRLAEQMRTAIREKLIDFEAMTAFGNCQTCQVLAIEFGIFSESEIPAAFDRLLKIIKRDNNRLLCGVIGARYMFHLLAQMGWCDLALDMILSPEYPSYANWVENGCTALCETFLAKGQTVRSGQYSQNHHFWGDISSFFIKQLVGLKPNPECRDVTEFEISPCFAKRLEFASCEYNSVIGMVTVAWKKQQSAILLTVQVPEGIKGDIKLPEGYSFADGGNIRKIENGSFEIEIL
ncbi:MAG: family 78 glycoside hydrolase catalytic domain [Clostridia bacterium]|nr:family 78 glycoside hydrolase catalytic domain [Clostridia bacterium]